MADPTVSLAPSWDTVSLRLWQTVSGHLSAPPRTERAGSVRSKTGDLVLKRWNGESRVPHSNHPFRGDERDGAAAKALSDRNEQRPYVTAGALRTRPQTFAVSARSIPVVS